jgi:DUF4097 and DUF4098 domain-containing protein YvlB
MNKEQFLKKLRRMIRALPPDELERILAYYREMIEDKVENGQAEEEAVDDLGDIRDLARKILSENPNRRPKNIGKIVAIAVLSLFGVVLVAAIVGVAAFRRVPAEQKGTTVDLPGIHIHGTDSNGGFSASGQDDVIVDLPGIHIDVNGAENGKDASASESFGTKTYTAKADGITALSVSAECKKVTVEPCDSDQITVQYATNSDQTYDFSVAGGTLTVKNTDNRSWNSLRSAWKINGQAPFITIRLPRKFAGAVSAETTNSDIRINGFQSLKSVACRTTNSAITIQDLSAQDLGFETKNAAINLQNVSASQKLSAETQNAQIGLEGVTSPDISLNTTNAIITGTILGREEDYTVSAHTTNAVSNLQNRTGGSKELSIHTTNAIISVNFES